MTRSWTGHVVVCGAHGVALRTIEQLREAGVAVVVVEDDAGEAAPALAALEVPVLPRGATAESALAEAGLDGARAVVCSERTDLLTLESALLVMDLREDARVVVHLDNPAVGRAVAETTGPGTVLDVAGLYAPAVVDVCLGRSGHDLDLDGLRLIARDVEADASGTLRERYGDLVPIAVTAGHDETVVVCPGRDHAVAPGDHVMLLGTPAAMARVAEHEASPAREAAAALRTLRERVAMAGHDLLAAADRSIRGTLLAGLLVLIVSSIVLHLAYRTDGGGRMPVLQAVYFTIETAATVGFGDFSFATQSPALQVFAIALIVAGTAIVSLLFAFVTNILVTRRIEQSLGHGRVRGMSGHVVLIGLGSVGMRVLEGLVAHDRQVVVVERDEENRYLHQARSLGVPVVVGDATLERTLDTVGLPRASSVAVLTSDDLANIETGLAVRDRLGDRWAEVPVLLRVVDRALGRRLADRFDFRHVWSTAAIAAPWFVGAAIGLEVLDTFYVGNVPFLVARMTVRDGGGLAGLRMDALDARVRVLALGRDGHDGTPEHPPRRDTRFRPGDAAYLVGPYPELLRLVRREGLETPVPTA